MSLNKRHLYHFLLIIGLILACYSNTFHSVWILDDLPNIVDNYPLHIDNLMPDSLSRTFYAKPFDYGTLYRPVPCVTFAINWYLGQDNPLGYHILNIAIHILTAIVLYQTILLLLLSAGTENKFNHRDLSVIALISSLIWALHPIQIQGVTYIVQRMTSLAALFYLCAILSYLKFRLNKHTLKNILSCLLFYVLAMLSKENASILPLSIVLIEYIFFRQLRDSFSRFVKKASLIAAGTVVLLATYYFFSRGLYTSLFDPIGSRPFSIYERLISQPEILLFYLSLLFFPHHSRFSIDHDVHLYHSILSPGALSSIFAIVLLLSIGLFSIRRYPLFAFAILFFFTNHLVESTVIPLELIFEHRNYLPSMFLFIPPAMLFIEIKNSIQKKNRLLTFIVFLFPLAACIYLAVNTYSRNGVWNSEEGLWLDAAQKAPDNARPPAKLGEIYGWKIPQSQENYNKSLHYLNRSLTGHTPRKSYKHAILGNIGEVCFMYGQYDQAIRYYKKSIELKPDFTNSIYGLAKTYIACGNFEQALLVAQQGIEVDRHQSRFYSLEGLIQLWLDRPDEAVSSFGKTLELEVNKRHQFYNLGVALSKAGYYKKAEWFLRLSQGTDFNLVLISLLENSILSENDDKVSLYSQLLLQKNTIEDINNYLEMLRFEYRNVPIRVDLLISTLAAKNDNT